jgi:hypothetical protein
MIEADHPRHPVARRRIGQPRLDRVVALGQVELAGLGGGIVLVGLAELRVEPAMAVEQPRPDPRRQRVAEVDRDGSDARIARAGVEERIVPAVAEEVRTGGGIEVFPLVPALGAGDQRGEAGQRRGHPQQLAAQVGAFDPRRIERETGAGVVMDIALAARAVGGEADRQLVCDQGPRQRRREQAGAALGLEAGAGGALPAPGRVLGVEDDRAAQAVAPGRRRLRPAQHLHLRDVPHAGVGITLPREGLGNAVDDRRDAGACARHQREDAARRARSGDAADTRQVGGGRDHVRHHRGDVIGRFEHLRIDGADHRYRRARLLQGAVDLLAGDDDVVGRHAVARPRCPVLRRLVLRLRLRLRGQRQSTGGRQQPERTPGRTSRDANHMSPNRCE